MSCQPSNIFWTLMTPSSRRVQANDNNFWTGTTNSGIWHEARQSSWNERISSMLPLYFSNKREACPLEARPAFNSMVPCSQRVHFRTSVDHGICSKALRKKKLHLAQTNKKSFGVLWRGVQWQPWRTQSNPNLLTRQKSRSVLKACYRRKTKQRRRNCMSSVWMRMKRRRILRWTRTRRRIWKEGKVRVRVVRIQCWCRSRCIPRCRGCWQPGILIIHSGPSPGWDIQRRWWGPHHHKVSCELLN